MTVYPEILATDPPMKLWFRYGPPLSATSFQQMDTELTQLDANRNNSFMGTITEDTRGQETAVAVPWEDVTIGYDLLVEIVKTARQATGRQPDDILVLANWRQDGWPFVVGDFTPALTRRSEQTIEAALTQSDNTGPTVDIGNIAIPNAPGGTKLVARWDDHAVPYEGILLVARDLHATNRDPDNIVIENRAYSGTPNP
jgi:hypothetical protein